MTAKKGAPASSKVKRLKLKKETIKDLDLRNRGQRIKGGLNCPGSVGRFGPNTGDPG